MEQFLTRRNVANYSWARQSSTRTQCNRDYTAVRCTDLNTWRKDVYARSQIKERDNGKAVRLRRTNCIFLVPRMKMRNIRNNEDSASARKL